MGFRQTFVLLSISFSFVFLQACSDDVTQIAEQQSGPLQITSMRVINADNDTVLSGNNPVLSGENVQIDLTQTPSINLLFNASEGTNSVKVTIDEDQNFLHTDSEIPFTIAPSSGRNFSPWSYLSVGTYTLRITPYEDANQTIPGDTATLTLNVIRSGPGPDTTPPTAPGNLNATVLNTTQVQLMWNPSSDNVAVDRYRIFRNGQAVANVNHPTTETTISGLSPNTAYSFFVRAFDTSDNISSPSNTVNVTTPPNGGGNMAYNEVGGLIVIEAENLSYPNEWVRRTSISDYTGNGYIRYEGPNDFNNPVNGIIDFIIKINTAGSYGFCWRNAIAFGNSFSEHNDSFAIFSTGQNAPGEYELPTNVKAYNNFPIGNWSWQTSNKDNDPQKIRKFFTAGFHPIRITGRSFGHAIDRITFRRVAQGEAQSCAFNAEVNSNPFYTDNLKNRAESPKVPAP